MVSITSASAHAGEMERKRKQTLERTRANHLSRQLQMRLQYARLKVEHGWQRQNLNEVENLYFHHSHRGTKTHHPRPSLVIVPSDDNSASSSSSNQLDGAYKTSMPRSGTLDTLLESSSQRSDLGTEGFPASTLTPPAPLTQTGVGSHDPSVTASSAVPEVPAPQLRERSHTPNQFSSLIASSMYNERSVPETISPAGSPSQGTTTTIINPTPLRRSQLFTPSSTGKSCFIRTMSPPTPGSAQQVNMPLLMHKNVSSLAKHDKFGSNMQATLTYDSFWSGIQSKSYPALKNGGSGNVNNHLSNNVPSTTTPPLSTLSMQSLAPTLASSTKSPPPPHPLPSHLHHPHTSSSITSSHAPTSLPSASTPTPSLLSQTAFLASPPPTQPLPIQMQQNRPLIDSLAVWNLIASQQYPGLINAQQEFNMGQLGGSATAYPFLANLGATYAQAFNGVTAEVQGSHLQGNEIGVSGNTTPPGVVVVVPPSNTSAVSTPVQPVGQEGS